MWLVGLMARQPISGCLIPKPLWKQLYGFYVTNINLQTIMTFSNFFNTNLYTITEFTNWWNTNRYYHLGLDWTKE